MKLLMGVMMLFIWSEPSGDEIRWEPSKKLSFTDFKGTIPSVTPWAANTSSTISFSYETVNNRLSNVVVYATFDRQRSWIKVKTAEVLRHEQLHFDITELFARKFYADVMKLGEISNPGQALSKLFKEANASCSQTQSDYDRESEHGVNPEKQRAWEEKIYQQLKAIQQYPGK